MLFVAISLLMHSGGDTICGSQADLPVGQVHILPLEGEDLAAATVVLTRSFTTSPDSVTLSLSRVEYGLAHAPTCCPQKPSTLRHGPLLYSAA